MTNWKNLRASIIFPIFLSFVIGIANFLDTALRLVFFYALGISYPLSVYLKPVFFILQIICFIIFFIVVKRTHLLIDGGSWKILNFHIMLTIIILVVYAGSFQESFFGLILPGQYIDFVWLLLFWFGLGLTTFWIVLQIARRQKVWIAIAFLILGLAYLVKPLESLYLWTQTHYDYSLPYSVVALGTFGPLLLMVSSLIVCSVFLCFKFRSKNNLLHIIRNPFLITAGTVVLVPVFLQGVRDGLPNMIIRTVGNWGLGYVGSGWQTASLYLASFVLYCFVIRQISKKLDESLSSKLLKLGALSLAWNGISILAFGYSSIAGNLLSLDAMMIGFMLKWKNDSNLALPAGKVLMP